MLDVTNINSIVNQFNSLYKLDSDMWKILNNLEKELSIIDQIQIEDQLSDTAIN